jgi:hypothetical protein
MLLLLKLMLLLDTRQRRVVETRGKGIEQLKYLDDLGI